MPFYVARDSPTTVRPERRSLKGTEVEGWATEIFINTSMNSIPYYKYFYPSTSVLRPFGLWTYAQDERRRWRNLSLINGINNDW